MRKISIIVILIAFAGLNCFGKKDKPSPEDSVDNTQKTAVSQQDDIFQDNDNSTLTEKSESAEAQFYPLQKKVEDVEEEIAELRARVIEYESRLSAPQINTDILKLIKIPQLKHEITLKNGTIVQGAIIHENTERLIVQTQIGQLTIEKGEITDIQDIATPVADVIFEGEAIEEIYADQRIYKGIVINDGQKRADFVRVIYKLWAEDTELVGTDSSFVDGSQRVYISGVVSDCSMEPGDVATFKVTVPISESFTVQYFTKEIRWDYFE